MGLIVQKSPETNPVEYFDHFDQIGEIKLERLAAQSACEMAIEHAIWILGVDVGILFESGKYLEDHNEGWLSKTKLMEPGARMRYQQGVVQRDDLIANNLLAAEAISEMPREFNAFILTGKRVQFSPNSNTRK